MTHALLLTDVVDSTRLSEELGDAAMAALWAAHDRVARDLLPVHRGREIDKTDGFLMLFEEVADAAAYALAYHRAIRALEPPIQARAGVHVGPVILTENSPEDVARGAKPLEVDGIAKPTAARIMSVAIGGQTLLSESAMEALGPCEHRVEAHGHWRMKGVAEPLALFEVGDADAPFTPPADGAKVYRVVRDGQHWLPVKQVKHSLPRERDAFIGRKADLQQLARLLNGGAALVSVLGIGGTGKTRLVTHYGWTWLGDWPGGVWFCDLSEARDLDGVVFAVARALDVPLGKGDPVAQLAHAIAGRGRCLVLLDNFEQLARHARETVGTWLDRAHQAAFVVTSREVLGLPGEHVLPIAPLAASDGAALFTARARSAKRDFEPDDAAAIEALVELLDRLPLAIELAASRVRLMSPSTLLDRMSERFKLLASSGGRHRRQATLRGALDWSWDLLSPDEQRALAQASVFEGGFTLEAAEGVLALESMWPMDAVQALVDKSLVRQLSDERFGLLMSVQEYAAEQLEAQAGRDATEVRHAAWFAELGREAAIEALEMDAADRRALALELDNLVAACRSSVTRGDGEPAVLAVRAAWEVLLMTGPFAMGLELVERVAAMPDLSPRDREVACLVYARALRLTGQLEPADAQFEAARAADTTDDASPARRRFEGRRLGGLGLLRLEQGRREEARETLDRALVLHREQGDRVSEAATLGNLGLLDWREGRLSESQADYEAALAIHRAIGSRRLEGVVLGNLGLLLLEQGRMDEARAAFEDGLEVHREVGNRRFEGVVLGNLGILHKQQGRWDQARVAYDAALAVAREVGDRPLEGTWLGILGGLNHGEGRLVEARAQFVEALAVHREAANRRLEGVVLVNLALLDRDEGTPDNAREHLGGALAAAREAGDRRTEGFCMGVLGELHRTEGRLDEARTCMAEGERLLRDLGDRLALAKLLCGLASLDVQDGDPAAARDRLAEARTLAALAGVGPESEIARRLAEVGDELESCEASA